jgi:putative MATE family efflux protein
MPRFHVRGAAFVRLRHFSESHRVNMEHRPSPPDPVGAFETNDQRAIRRRVLWLALPIVGSDLLQRGVNVVDALLVGRLGAAELAAVGLSQLLLMFVMALVYGLGVGATVMVAFHTGATDARRRALTGRTVLVVGAAATLILGSAGILFSAPVARFMGADGRLLHLTLDYLHITWYLFAAYVYLHLMSAVFQGVGDTRTPLKAMLWVNVLHLLLAIPLIFGLWGLPRLGVKGAALASGVSEGVGAGWLVWQAARRGLLGAKRAGWSPSELRRMLRVGLPAMGERVLTHGMQVVYARIVIHFGVAAYAAHQVGLNIESLSFLPGLGFAKAATALVGQRLGAKDPEGARQSARQANLLGLGIMSAWGVAFVLFPHAWIALFTSDPEVLAYSVPLMTVMGILQPPLAVAMVISGALRGAGETHVVLAAALLGGWCVRLPLAYLGGVAGAFGMSAVWATMVLDWLVRGAIVSWRFSRLRLKEVRL